MSAKLSLYFSHSWHPTEVDLNLFCWSRAADRCNLLVDLPDEPTPDPPYYINRLEAMLRRSDLFLAVLPYRPRPDRAGAPATRSDAGMECSPGILFEIRLAERADLPRLILYDIRTGFRAPDYTPRHARYVGQNFDELRDRVLTLGDWLAGDLDEWLSWACDHIRPRRHEHLDTPLVLLPERLPHKDQVMDQIAGALAPANYKRPVAVDGTFSHDAELGSMLASGGLLVAELSVAEEMDLYSVAHARFIPAIRLYHRPDDAPGRVTLPRLLRGHPGGYEHDVIAWTDPADLSEAIQKHAKAMMAAARTISGFEPGKPLFLRHRYKPHRVFISHNMRRDRRELVDGIIRGCKDGAINCWEYAENNQVAEKWKPHLESELEKMTHFLALFSDDYEQSGPCVFEFEWALKHPERVTIIPFLIGGRVKPHVKINEYHHDPLLGDDPARNADRVVEKLVQLLLAPA